MNAFVFPILCHQDLGSIGKWKFSLANIEHWDEGDWSSHFSGVRQICIPYCPLISGIAILSVFAFCLLTFLLV